MHATLALVSPEPASPLATLLYGSLREMRRVSVCVCVDVTQFHPLPWHRAELQLTVGVVVFRVRVRRRCQM